VLGAFELYAFQIAGSSRASMDLVNSKLNDDALASYAA